MNRQQNQNYDRNNDPAVFVNAQIRRPKNGGNRYIWSRTFDLRNVMQDLGTSIVTVKVIIPKERQNEDDRIVVLSASEAKYLPDNRSNGNGNGNGNGNRKNSASSGSCNARDDDDDLL